MTKGADFPIIINYVQIYVRYLLFRLCVYILAVRSCNMLFLNNYPRKQLVYTSFVIIRNIYCYYFNIFLSLYSIILSVLKKRNQ